MLHIHVVIFNVFPSLFTADFDNLVKKNLHTKASAQMSATAAIV